MGILPDWLTHIGVTYLIIWMISKITKLDIKCRKYYPFFLIGGVMPDIERILSLISEFENYHLKEFFSVILTSGFHTIMGILCLALALTSFFPNEKIKLVYISLVLGGLFHLLIDLIMWPWPDMGLILFYPFLNGPRFTFSFHLVWPGGFEPLIFTSVGVALSIIVDGIQKKSLISLNYMKQLFKKKKLDLKITQ